jgi:predicted PolB exonuclease-like 3'-5' exonuclease
MLTLDEDYMPRKGGCAAGGLAGGKSEREMIARWSEIASGKLWAQNDPLRLVDYNGSGFDVPVLQTRAFRYGIPLPWYFGKLRDKYGEFSEWSKDYRDKLYGWHLDLQRQWTNSRAFWAPQLEHLARLMGLPGKNGFDGAKVHAAYQEGRFVEIDNYCMQDVLQTTFIFVRYQHLAGKLSLDRYREVCGALLEFSTTLPATEAFLAGIDRAALLLEEE